MIVNKKKRKDRWSYTGVKKYAVKNSLINIIITMVMMMCCIIQISFSLGFGCCAIFTEAMNFINFTASDNNNHYGDNADSHIKE